MADVGGSCSGSTCSRSSQEREEIQTQPEFFLGFWGMNVATVVTSTETTASFAPLHFLIQVANANRVSSREFSMRVGPSPSLEKGGPLPWKVLKGSLHHLPTYRDPWCTQGWTQWSSMIFSSVNHNPIAEIPAMPKQHLNRNNPRFHNLYSHNSDCWSGDTKFHSGICTSCLTVLQNLEAACQFGCGAVVHRFTVRSS